MDKPSVLAASIVVVHSIYLRGSRIRQDYQWTWTLEVSVILPLEKHWAVHWKSVQWLKLVFELGTIPILLPIEERASQPMFGFDWFSFWKRFLTGVICFLDLGVLIWRRCF